MKLPDSLEPYRCSGEELVRKHAVTRIEFSGPTYQVLVDNAWVFLQLDEEYAQTDLTLHSRCVYAVKDVFCNCATSSQKGACEHMAAACFAVFRKQPLPLHERFKHSFWNCLFYALHKEYRSPLHITGGCVMQKKRCVFEITGEGSLAEMIMSFVTKQRDENEENSIKFSSLSEEELEQWRQGNPSVELQYELSPFSDIAKFLFLTEAKKRVQFEGEGLPNKLIIHVQDIFITVGISQTILTSIIPSLSTVDSSLKCFDSTVVNISSMQWDAKKSALVIERGLSPFANRKGIAVGSWTFIPNVGFVAAPVLTGKEVLQDQECIPFFNDFLFVIKQHFPPSRIHEAPHSCNYELFFDKDKSLHIVAWLFEKRDLESGCFGNWAYIQEKGFVCIEPLMFDTPHFIVSADEIPAFITMHRHWLNHFSGFGVFTSFIQEVRYEVDAYGMLHFFAKEGSFQREAALDFGKWIWILDKGFYRKEEDAHHAIPLEAPIPVYAVSTFIRNNQDALHTVEGFFASDCPISAVGLKIDQKSKKVIEINPEYTWKNPDDANKALFFDEYVFVPEKGFYCLPPNLRSLHFLQTISQDDEVLWNSFFQEMLPRLRTEYHCTIDPRLENVAELALVAKPLSQQGAFEWDVDLYWRVKDKKILASELIKAHQQNERFVVTEAGIVDLQDDRFHWLARAKKKKKRGDAGFQLTSQDFVYLAAHDTVAIEEGEEKQYRNFKGFLQQLMNISSPVPIELKGLASDLREYQKNGVLWLWFLYQNGLSGLLCDDMGVGKTHQAMGLMAAVKEYNGEKEKPLFAVICPTTLIYHWQDKLQRFLPTFRVKVYTGTARTLDDFPEDYDLLLTSYGIWRNEARHLSHLRFEVAFFDELQIAKNHISRIYAALVYLNARMKVGLTGTPIENNLRELKALFDIVLPGYMPDTDEYREFFIRSIERENDKNRKNLLARYIKPFVLRRKKQDVLSDLPQKSEEVCVAELVGEQKLLYRHVVSMQATPLLQQLKSEHSSIPYMHIFALLSSLKQICNHPAAYLNDMAHYERYESGKWETFVELLEEAQESQQKVVVFSQYLAMLDIIQLFCEKKKIEYASIRGETKNRKEEIERFQCDPACQIFIGSLHAAGLGIDLTAASVVIHYDRWWNAARENQATDRVHRIGQARGVQVFKLMTRETVEERIDKMILRKATLLEDVLSFDDQHLIKKLTRDEIIALLEEM